MRRRVGLPRGIVAAVVTVVVLAVVVSGDWLLIVPAGLALAAAGGPARSLRMTKMRKK